MYMSRQRYVLVPIREEFNCENLTRVRAAARMWSTGSGSSVITRDATTSMICTGEPPDDDVVRRVIYSAVDTTSVNSNQLGVNLNARHDRDQPCYTVTLRLCTGCVYSNQAGISQDLERSRDRFKDLLL